MRRRTLKLRPEITLLPAREALLEFVVRLSLGQREKKIPLPRGKVACGRLRTMVQVCSASRGATVEDTAEAALRIYAHLAKLKNDYLDENRVCHSKNRRGRSSNRSKGGGQFQSFQ